MSTRVLVVDDEDTLRTVIRQVLTDDQHEVVEATSAEQALDLYRQEPFQIVLTDIVMDKMTGLDLLKQIGQIDPECLVIIMTSHASLDTAIDALRSGAYDFLIKPFEDIEMISAVVYRAIDRVKLMQSNRELLERLQKYATKLEGLNDKLQSMVDRDGVTGLYNHRFLRQALDIEIARSDRHGRVFSLLFLDVDHFKVYNDTYGHLAGDELLKGLARLLQRECRRSDTVARYGGEEFVLLLPETNKDGALTFAKRLLKTIGETTFEAHDDQPMGRVTVSGGVASYPEHATSATDVIDRADRALYRVKQTGRNQVVCCDEVEDVPRISVTAGGTGRPTTS